MPAYESLQSKPSVVAIDGRSDRLIKTPVRGKSEPRLCYLKYRDTLPPPHIVHSQFVPKATVEFLMRYKKDSAVGVKFFPGHPGQTGRLDRITNLEGALHTFVTPIVRATMHGDYRWVGYHGIHEFGLQDNYQLGREVLVSALVQQDFEGSRVMMKVAALGSEAIIGSPHLPQPILTKDKQDSNHRARYDDAIRNYLVHHLTLDRRLPAITARIKENALTLQDALGFIARGIESDNDQRLRTRFQDVFFYHDHHICSLEVMFRSAVHQIRNEMALLERLCSKQGYVYTFNPPAIFVRAFGTHGTELLSRIHVAALKYVASTTKFHHCKVFAWADFNSSTILSLVKIALACQPHILVMRNDALFAGGKAPGSQHAGLYSPPVEGMGAMLVIHNNSDAFGQNIETEPSGGSLDGVIGTYSSTAGSLMRDRHDLCSHLYTV